MSRPTIRSIVVSAGVVLFALPGWAFDDECIEYVASPSLVYSWVQTDRLLVLEVPDRGEMPRRGRLEGIHAGGTLRFRIDHLAEPGEQIFVDVELVGEGSAFITRSGTDLECRRISWMVLALDADDEPVWNRDLFEVVLGPTAVRAAPDPSTDDAGDQPLWAPRDTLVVKIGVGAIRWGWEKADWCYLSEIVLHPEAPLP